MCVRKANRQVHYGDYEEFPFCAKALPFFLWLKTVTTHFPNKKTTAWNLSWGRKQAVIIFWEQKKWSQRNFQGCSEERLSHWKDVGMGKGKNVCLSAAILLHGSKNKPFFSPLHFKQRPSLQAPFDWEPETDIPAGWHLNLFSFFKNEDWQTITSHQLGPRAPAGDLFRVTWTSNRERGWLHLLLIKSELWVPWDTAASGNVDTFQQLPHVHLHLDWEAKASTFHQNNE